MAGYSTPYAFANYLGEWANDAAALAEIQARKWDSTADGTGTPQNGMMYYATGAHQVRTYIAGAWVWMGTSVSSTLDAAYNASAGPAAIAVDAGDVTWNLTGAFSFVVDASGCTGAVDGFGVEDGTDYFRVRHAAANTLDMTGALGVLNIATSGAATIDSDAAATFKGASVTIDADGGVATIDATGAVSINSSAAVINIGNNNIAQNINIGTDGARTIKIGSAAATALDLDADGAITIDSITAGISIDAHTISNFSVNGANQHMTVECFGGGAQKLFLSSAGTGIDAVDINATAGGVAIDGSKSSNFTVTGAAQSLTLGVAGGGIQGVIVNSAGTGASAIDLNATAGGASIDTLLGVSIDAHTISNFSVNGANQHMTVECFGGGAQKLLLTSAGTGVDAIDMTATAGGIEIDAVKASHFIVSGATADLTFGARGSTIALNAAAPDDALAGFTATSIIGAFNELKNDFYVMSGTVANAATYVVNAGDAYEIVHVTRTTAGPCSIEFKSAWIAVDYNTIKIKDTGANSFANNITLWTEGAELFEGDAAGGLIKSDRACWTIQAYGGNLYIID